MKRLLIALLFMSLVWSVAVAQDTTLKTGIQWDEEKARTVALKHLNEEVDVTQFQGMDPHFTQNRQVQQSPDANTRVAHHQVTRYTAGDYSVAYDGENIVNYYHTDGGLAKVSICSTPFGADLDYSNYPRKCVEYGYPHGKIMAVSLDVSPSESFVFQPDGKLRNHWIGSKGYDDKKQALWERH